MDNNALQIESTFLLAYLTGGNPDPSFRIKDFTNYVAQGITNAQVSGIITGKNGASIFYQNTNYASPDINRGVSDLSTPQSLPLDSNNKVLQASYEFIYSVKITNEILFASQAGAPGSANFTTVSITSIGASTIALINGILANPQNTNVRLRFKNGSGTILGDRTVTSLSATTNNLNFSSVNLPSFADIDEVEVISDTFYSKSFTYSYCDKKVSPELCVSSSCLLSQITAVNQTEYPSFFTVARELKIQYPRKSDGTPVSAPITTNTASLTLGPNIYTGNYTVSSIDTIAYTQDDGLVINDIIKAYVEHNVTCKYSLCALSACISSVYERYKSALLTGSANTANLFAQNMRILLLCNLYNIAVSCKDEVRAVKWVTELSNYLDNDCGCDCGCGSEQDQSEPTIIYPGISTPNP
jgi:hypothetical protein